MTRLHFHKLQCITAQIFLKVIEINKHTTSNDQKMQWTQAHAHIPHIHRGALFFMWIRLFALFLWEKKPLVYSHSQSFVATLILCSSLHGDNNSRFRRFSMCFYNFVYNLNYSLTQLTRHIIELYWNLFNCSKKMDF